MLTIFDKARNVLKRKWLDRKANAEFSDALVSEGNRPLRNRPKECVNRALLWVDPI